MGAGSRALGRAVEGTGAALAREPPHPRHAVRGAHHEAGQIGHAVRAEARLQPAEVAAQRRYGARCRAPAEGAQELAIGDGPAGPRRADQEAGETVQLDQGWPPSIG